MLSTVCRNARKNQRGATDTVLVRCRRPCENDIAVDMKQALEEKGYKVSVLNEGLGQNAAILDIYMDHIKFIMENKPLDINEKKKEYSKGKDAY